MLGKTLMRRFKTGGNGDSDELVREEGGTELVATTKSELTLDTPTDPPGANTNTIAEKDASDADTQPEGPGEGQAQQPGTAQSRLYAFLDDPESSIKAKHFSEFMMLLILISLLTLILEPDPALKDWPKELWVCLDTIIVLFFCFDLFGRYWAYASTPNALEFSDAWPWLRRMPSCMWMWFYTRSKFMSNMMNWADFMSILPFFLDLITNGGIVVPPQDPADDTGGNSGGSLMRGLRTIRLFRILRIMKVGRYNSEFGTFLATLKKSSSALRILVLLMFLQILVFSVIVFDLEKDENEAFRSVPTTMWWAVVTACTVGYGDLYPITNAGKVVAAISMFTGLIVMSLPLSIIGANCVREYMQLQEAKLLNFQKEQARMEKERTILNRRISMQQDSDPRRARYLRIRQLVYDTASGEGRYGMPVMVAVCLAITTSITSIIGQSMPELENRISSKTWQVVDALCVVVFTLEIVARVATAPDYMKYSRDLLNWIDILATLPWYISNLSTNDDLDILKVLRALRVVRLLKLFRHDPGIKVLLETLSNSGSAVLMYLAVVCANMLFFSVAVFEFERGDYDVDCECYKIDGEKSKFESVVIGFYWTIATISTVGYGDIQPVTTGGQIVGSLCCVLGGLSIMLPLTIIGVNFCAAYDKHQLLSQAEDFLDTVLDEVELSRAACYEIRDTMDAIRNDLDREFKGLLGFQDLFEHISASRNIVLHGYIHVQLERNEGMGMDNELKSDGDPGSLSRANSVDLTSPASHRAANDDDQ